LKLALAGDVPSVFWWTFTGCAAVPAPSMFEADLAAADVVRGHLAADGVGDRYQGVRAEV